MNVKKICENGKITLTPEGWLDTSAAPILGEAIDELGEFSELVLDFSSVEYMASAGLRQVVAAHRKAAETGARFSVINVCSDVMSIFRMTGTEKKLGVSGK